MVNVESVPFNSLLVSHLFLVLICSTAFDFTFMASSHLTVRMIMIMRPGMRTGTLLQLTSPVLVAPRASCKLFLRF